MKLAAVSRDIRYSAQGERTGQSVITSLMTKALENRDLLSIAAGFTDNAVLPADLVRRAVEDLLAEGKSRETLQYGLNQGRAGLREEIVRRLGGHAGERAGVFRAEDVLVTNGSQQCLYLAMQMLCDPGDMVLVERPSYFVFLEMLKGLGIEAVGMPEDGKGGIDLEGLGNLLEELDYAGKLRRVKAIYLVSYFGNPSSRCLPEETKSGLARVLEERDVMVPVIEDGAYRDLYFERPYPARTVFSLEAWEGFPKLFLGTFTKPFSTGLKIGFGVCSEVEWREKMLTTKGHQDFGSGHFAQAIIEKVLQAGWYDEYLAGLRSHYGRKAALMHAALEAHGLREAGWSWERPEGGLLLWAGGPEGLDTRIGSRFCEDCIAAGVLFVPGDLSLTGNEPRNYVRLSFGALELERLEEASRRFCQVARNQPR